MIRAGETLAWSARTRLSTVFRSIESGGLVCLWKECCRLGSLLSLKNWLAFGGVVLSCYCKALKMSKHCKRQKIKNIINTQCSSPLCMWLVHPHSFVSVEVSPPLRGLSRNTLSRYQSTSQILLISYLSLSTMHYFILFFNLVSVSLARYQLH